VAHDSSLQPAQNQEIVMDPYVVQYLFTARHDDLVREADESRLTREARNSHEESRPAQKPVRREKRARGFRLA
jgi:hypothetical protein